MSRDRFSTFASSLAQTLLRDELRLKQDPKHANVIHAVTEKSEVYTLDLTPFVAKPAEPTASVYFASVQTVSQLLSAYQAAKSSLPFEMDLPAACENVSGYANDFLMEVLAKANASLNDTQARLIAGWVRHLDVYCAVKSVESFVYSHADLKLLELAPSYHWDVVFDHMAIRCGSREHQDAERISELLKKHHGYVATQFPGEAFYQFPEGWNAYPVYKILSNGQVLRVFVDQSDEDHPAQIIQHWNKVYGYTAHHLGIRATMLRDGVRVAVPLADVMAALEKEDIKIMTPTGQYTQGILLQVFTQPERNTGIPPELKAEVVKHGEQLSKAIENAKLLELVSRKEMPHMLAKAYFELYGIHYDANNPLHSAPVYQYFLPAQAAHVIRTSQQVA
jgi:hypothetical protein